MPTTDRRVFLAAAGGATLSALGLARRAVAQQTPRFEPQEGDEHRGAAAIASGNGIPAVSTAMEMIGQGADPVDAIVAGVAHVENDPRDMSVGYGGLPNELGVVQLDASVMHGPTHKAGAVACIEDIKNPAAVALTVLKRTDHVMLVGAGAKRFALQWGFKEEDLLTDRAREAWLKWKRNLNPNDDWLDDDQLDFEVTRADPGPVPFTYGTINCSAVDGAGDLASCTTTSGLSYKIPGRVGDSPIVGAGMFCDNTVGAAGATGRGEAVIQNCGAFAIVRQMEAGMAPTEACLAVLKKIADNTKQRRLLRDDGRPNFNVSMYAVRKDGAYGSACMWPGGTFAVKTATGDARRLRCTSLFQR